MSSSPPLPSPPFFLSLLGRAAQVFGSILTGGSGAKKDKEPRRCRTCERLKEGTGTGTGRSSASSSPNAERGLGDHERGGQGETDGAVTPCGHKHVDFAPVVSAVYVPVHTEYR